ncbi:MAG: M28 family peptidase [Brumimicrobium sp.]
MNKYISTLILLATAIFSFSQNSVPEVEIQNVSIDQVAQTVSITYDLTDLDDDSCSVWLKVSNNGGEFYEVIDNSNISGDIGEDLLPGNSKSITWEYASYTSTIFDIDISVNASDNYDFDIQNFVDQVDSTEIKDNLSFIEGIRHYSANPTKLNAVRDSIDDIFVRNGLETERQEFTFSGNSGFNILGKKTGLKDEAITFIIDGHYDGVSNSPAADDNGSAVSGMLEILRVLSQYDFEHTIRFIGFDFEEAGLIGSQRYVTNGIESYEDIQGVLNFEMIGYYSEDTNSQTLPAGFDLLFPQAVQDIEADSSRGNFLVVCGNANSNSLISDFVNYSNIYVPDLRVISLEVPGNGEIAPDLRRSDHTPFWESGRKALMLTDGADTRNFNYHTPADTMGTLNFDFMTKNVKATLATLAELAVPISAGTDSYNLGLLSIHEHNHDTKVKVSLYPNPSDGQFTLSYDVPENCKFRIEIYDLNGKLLSKKIVEAQKGSSEEALNFKNISSGEYIVNIISTDFTETKRMIIE